MVLILLEALGALLLLIFIVWWTMFSGRKKGELSAEPETPADPAQTHALPGTHDAAGSPGQRS